MKGTPSFDSWVPQASQAEEEQNKRLTGNIKELISEMETAIGETKPPKVMEEKLERLAKANEDLNAQNRDLWAKLKMADEKIKGLEVEKRAKNNLIRALCIRLRKEKGELPPQQTQLQVVPFTPRVAQEEVEEEAPNFGASLGEETSYAATVGHETERVIAAFPMAMELHEQREGGEQEEEAHLYMIVNMIAENEENADIGKKKEEKGAPGKQKEKKNMEIMSIEKNVKTYKQGEKKAKEADWEYDTQEESKMRKRAPPKRARIVPLTRKMENKIKIKGVNCDKPTWRTLDPAIGKHFQKFFNATAKDTVSNDLLSRITKHDLRVIIQEGDVETNVVRVYIDLLKSDAGKLKAKVGFLRVDAAYCDKS
ncbi:uncharacterized protein LOC121052019 isoform X3 [Rosa chinensis]|uniref:uncharacterized protein LOC121052019 isoform X3 n=1 Tax=Rosa chinensis TaxID=74649 RepID=UPI001AD94BE4|nr:uncharacterized protein LOC121052019 isoform X3 [Rosa chinensis]